MKDIHIRFEYTNILIHLLENNHNLRVMKTSLNHLYQKRKVHS